VLSKRALSSFSLANEYIESLVFNNLSYTENLKNILRAAPVSSYAYGIFDGCNKLKFIHPLDVRETTTATNMFNGCVELLESALFGLKTSISYKDSASISKTSILHTIINATPTSAITITLHPDAYARLADDADVVAALETQPLVSLVSA
jgi:hypothetical protein